MCIKGVSNADDIFWTFRNTDKEGYTLTKGDRISIIVTEKDLNDMAAVVTLMNSGKGAFMPTVSRHGLCRTLLRQGIAQLLTQLTNGGGGVSAITTEGFERGI